MDGNVVAQALARLVTDLGYAAVGGIIGALAEWRWGLAERMWALVGELWTSCEGKSR